MEFRKIKRKAFGWIVPRETSAPERTANLSPDRLIQLQRVEERDVPRGTIEERAQTGSRETTTDREGFPEIILPVW